jgi:hypothetical protein
MINSNPLRKLHLLSRWLWWWMWEVMVAKVGGGARRWWWRSEVTELKITLTEMRYFYQDYIENQTKFLLARLRYYK